MFGKSVTLKLLAVVLCATLSVTLIAVVAKKSKSSSAGDSKVETPTQNQTETNQTPEDTGGSIVVDDTKTIVAAKGLNSYFAWSQYEETSTRVLATVVSDLKPGAKYRLAFSIDEDSLPDGCALGADQKYLLALSGKNSVGNALKQTKTQFTAWGGSGLPAEGTVDFTVNSDFYYVPDSTGKAAMVFVFVGFTAASDEEANTLSKQIGDCITFTLYELTESGS